MVIKLRTLIGFTFFLCTSISFASVATVSFVLGKVERANEKGGISIVTKKTLFAASDIITTKKNGQLMLKMSDESKITLRPNTTFNIADYSYTKNTKTDKSHYNLIKGGFRYITGKMGKKNQSSYRLKTAYGTIGIRGTDFEANICESQCNTNRGFFINVVSGGVSLNNKNGSLDIDRGHYGQIKSQLSAPETIQNLPEVLRISNIDEGNTDSSSTNKKHATPEEQMVAISIGQSPSNDLAIELVAEAGLPTQAIFSVAHQLKLEPTLIANILLNSGVDSKEIIETSIKQFPEYTSKLLTMGIATHAISTKQAASIALKNGVKPAKLKSIITTGKLLRPPVINKHTQPDKVKKTIRPRPTQIKRPGSRANPRRVNPQLVPKGGNAGGSVPSPS